MNELSMDMVMNVISPLIIGDRILDVGTGFGTVIKALIKNKNINITSIDPEMWSFDMLKNTFLDEIYKNRLRLLKLSIEENGFNDNQFSTSISLFSAHHFKDVIKAMNEMYRITERSIIIADWTPESSEITNPHKPRELKKPMELVIDYAEDHGYIIKRNKMWYLVYKIND
ncbi:class I SAM-dependent methyltransferase [Picrophilus oshimae]|nr:methyltransferase domain-containing protein [Picrophilus oshimae]